MKPGGKEGKKVPGIGDNSVVLLESGENSCGKRNAVGGRFFDPDDLGLQLPKTELERIQSHPVPHSQP